MRNGFAIIEIVGKGLVVDGMKHQRVGGEMLLLALLVAIIAAALVFCLVAVSSQSDAVVELPFPPRCSRCERACPIRQRVAKLRIAMGKGLQDIEV